MATHQIILKYTVTVTNVTAAAMATAMAAVPLYATNTAPNSTDPVLSQIMGLTVATDVSAPGLGFATRVITLNMDATLSPPAPAPFVVHSQTVDGQAAIFSTSVEDAPVVLDAGNGCIVACPPDCPPAATQRPGIGAWVVQITYTDAEGNAGVATVTLQGRMPVQIPLAAGTNGVAVITGMVILSAGSLGSSVGQITVSVLEPHGCPASTTTGGITPCPVCSQNPSAQDKLQNRLGQALAYLPNSYYSYAMQTNPTTTGECAPAEPCDPCPPCDPFTIVPAPPPPTPSLLIAMLTNFFTNALSLALAAPVVAATPTLV